MRDASHQQTAQVADAAAAHDDEVGAFVFRVVEDPFGRVAVGDLAGDVPGTMLARVVLCPFEQFFSELAADLRIAGTARVQGRRRPTCGHLGLRLQSVLDRRKVPQRCGQGSFGAHIEQLYPGVVFAGITNVDQLWALANISVAASALPNLVALLVLSGVFMTLMKDYLSGKNQFATEITDENKQYIRMAQR